MSASTIGIDAIQALGAFDTPTIANAMESLQITPRSFLGPRIHSVSSGGAIVGLAVTATMKDQWGGKFAHIEPWLHFLEAIEAATVPCIAVFQDDSNEVGRQAMIGEGMSRLMRVAGATGAICGGTIRDVAALRDMAFPVWASGLTADRGGIRFHRHQVPIEVDGMRVTPGDLIHADENGALVVPTDRVVEIINAAEKVNANEAKLFKMVAEPGFGISRLHQFYAEALQSARAEQQAEF